MGILENLPLGGVMLQPLFLLIRFAVGLEVDRVPQVLLPGKHIDDGAVTPKVIITELSVIRNIDASALCVCGGV